MAASMIGQSRMKIIVPTMILPVMWNHVLSKSLSIPYKKKENGCSLISALTRRSRKAVLKNCT